MAHYAKNVHTSPDEKSKLTTVGDYIFYHDGENGYYLMGYAGNEKSVTLPSKINGQYYAIYQYAFYECGSLTSVVIPDSVTSIEASALFGCKSLTSVTIGNSVTSIEQWAFSECGSLKAVYYKGTAENWNKITIGSFNTNLTDAPRYFYSESNPFEGENAVTCGNYWHYDENGEIRIWSVA